MEIVTTHPTSVNQCVSPADVGTFMVYGGASDDSRPLSPESSPIERFTAARPLHRQIQPGSSPPSLLHSFPADAQAIEGGEHAAIPLHQQSETTYSFTLKPISPAEVMRYDRVHKRDERNVPRDIIPPLTKEFKHHLHTSPYGWRRREHPEGAMFFEHRASRTYTDKDIGDEITCLVLQDIMQELRDRLRAHETEQANDEELVLEHLEANEWGYYFASHKHRTVFWVHEYPMPCHEVEAISSEAQRGHEVESYFWQHVELFPTRLPKGSIRALDDYLTQASIDNITSTESLSPYKSETIKAIKETVGTSKEDDPDNHATQPSLVWGVARIMSHHYHAKFVHYHGELMPRLCAGQVLNKKDERPNSRLFKMASFLLFGRPTAALIQLKSVYADEVIVLATWEKYVQGSVAKWKDNADLCRMAVNYNLAFMAVPSVIRAINDNSSSTSNSAAAQHWTLAQLLSTCSTILLTGSMVSNFLLREHYADDRQRDVTWASNFLSGQYNNPGFFLYGLERLAILSSLPLTWIIWGSFLLALSFSCWIFESTFVISYRVTVTVLFVFTGIVGLLTSGLWYGIHDPAHAENWTDTFRQIEHSAKLVFQGNWTLFRTNVSGAAKRMNPAAAIRVTRRRTGRESDFEFAPRPLPTHQRPVRRGTAPMRL